LGCDRNSKARAHHRGAEHCANQGPRSLHAAGRIHEARARTCRCPSQ
jgi:hypothetical protein